MKTLISFEANKKQVNNEKEWTNKQQQTKVVINHSDNDNSKYSKSLSRKVTSKR